SSAATSRARVACSEKSWGTRIRRKRRMASCEAARSDRHSLGIERDYETLGQMCELVVVNQQERPGIWDREVYRGPIARPDLDRLDPRQSVLGIPAQVHRIEDRAYHVERSDAGPGVDEVDADLLAPLHGDRLVGERPVEDEERRSVAL